MSSRWTKFAAIFLLSAFSVTQVAWAKDKDKDKKDSSSKPSARSEVSNRINEARENAAKSARSFESRSAPRNETPSVPKFSGSRESDKPKFSATGDDQKSRARSFAADQFKQNSNSARSFEGSGNRNRFDSSNNPSSSPARTFTPNTPTQSGNPNVRSFPSKPSNSSNPSGTGSNIVDQFRQRGTTVNPGGNNIRPYQPNNPSGNIGGTLTPNTVNRPKVIEGMKPETKSGSVVGDENRSTEGFGRSRVGGTPYNPNPNANPTNPTGPTLGNPNSTNPGVVGDRNTQTFPGRFGSNTPRVGDGNTGVVKPTDPNFDRSRIGNNNPGVGSGKPDYKSPDILKPGDPRFDRGRVGDNTPGGNDKPDYKTPDILKPGDSKIDRSRIGSSNKSDNDGPALGDGRSPFGRPDGKDLDKKGPDGRDRDLSRDNKDLDRDGKPDNRVVGDSNRFYDRKRDDNHVHHESKIKDVSKTSWAKRIDGDRIDRLAVGTKTEKLKLDKQFELQHRGDVARQMNLREHLHDHGGWNNRPYQGPVYAGYRDRAFQRSYCGPSWYPRHCWYPSWRPWVNWSWYFTVPSIWDPRPVYCRPIIYQPAVAWTYWATPAWQPLPVVASGTWVDVPPASVERDDLQLLAVRFVDPGHPGNDLGARYRVWVRNNSTEPINTPFNVVVMGTLGQQVTDARLEAGVRVPSIEPNQILPIDVRLPLNLPSGDPLDFDTVQVLVDSHRELNEANEANNGAMLARGDIEPVDPAVFSADSDVVLAGAVVNLAGEGLGPEPGEVILQIGDQQSQVEVVGWYDLGVQVRIPQVPLAGLTGAELMIVRGDGAASNPLPVQMASAESGETY